MTQRLETLLPQIVNYRNEMKQIEEKMEFLKLKVAEEMEKQGLTTEQVYFDDENNIKVTYGESGRQTLDKERLAKMFNVEEDAVKTDFILKKVDDDDLTYDEYRDSFYPSREMKVSIRLVKP